MSRPQRILFGLLLTLVVTAASAARQTGPPARTIPRFDRGTNPIALTGPARPARYMEASGRRAAFLGGEDGSFEAWVYPLKVPWTRASYAIRTWDAG